MTDRFDDCLAFVLQWEGSKFTNDPDDRGGATRYGIIQREYDSYRKSLGLDPQSVEFITDYEVGEIYRHSYWDRVNADTLPEPLDLFMFDSAVQHGPKKAIQFLQRALGITDDGVIGRQTMTSVREDVLSGALAALLVLAISARRAFYDAIVKNDSTQKKWRKGWENRLLSLQDSIDKTMEA